MRERQRAKKTNQNRHTQARACRAECGADRRLRTRDPARVGARPRAAYAKGARRAPRHPWPRAPRVQRGPRGARARGRDRAEPHRRAAHREAHRRRGRSRRRPSRRTRLSRARRTRRVGVSAAARDEESHARRPRLGARLRHRPARPDEVREEDTRGRRDLRELEFVTIDGETAKDFDDAVVCRREQTGGKAGFRLWVAIADVSHYVRHGDALDTDARERGTSVYFPRRVIPMLPVKLSNGICSLNPRVDRLALVFQLAISAQGELGDYKFYPAVFRSHARLTYTKVWAELQTQKPPEHLSRLYEL